MNTLMTLGGNFVELFLDSAPWLLLGLLIAGLIKVFIPMVWMQRQLGGEGFWPTFKAAVLGAPLPLCSCGVIPAAVGLRRSGASKSATTAFLVATPETGVDSVSLSYVLLGPFMAVVRPITAISSAIVAGLLVGRDDEHTDKPSENAGEAGKSCCGSAAAKVKPVQQVDPKSAKPSCCASKAEPQPKVSACCAKEKPQPKTSNSQAVGQKLREGVSFAANDLVRDTTKWLLVGLFFAALVNTLVPASFLAQWGSGILAMTLMVLVSVPMYICASASTPIAAGFLLAGVSPGAVLVFMMAGPATNIATLGVVRNELGKRALWAYLGGVIGTAMLAGFAVDWAVAEFGFSVMPMVGHEHRLLPDGVVYFSGVLLMILMVRALLLRSGGNQSGVTGTA
ncbi:SO_0444 family Cu/Zn efflux transporter [Ferrimonas gelatinilytica]|uniref:Permease n=1 Tax=Ferrimonas gelatinilytica TaxID=1255257 RepID=A0ABP9SB01_9GAMM